MIVYYFSKDRKGYYEGSEEERVKYHPDSLIVSQRPSIAYEYNFEKDRWEKTEISVKRVWQEKRNEMLRKTYWLLMSPDTPLTLEEKEKLKRWRISLQNMFEDPQSATEPTYPEFLKKWM